VSDDFSDSNVIVIFVRVWVHENHFVFLLKLKLFTNSEQI